MSTATMFVTVCVLVLVLALEVQVRKMTGKLDELLRQKPMPLNQIGLTARLHLTQLSLQI